MHGTIMLPHYATSIVFGFANIVLPPQIGAPDVAFPRLNALSFWLFVFGAAIVFAGFITPGGAADFGWTAYAPLSNAIPSGTRSRRTSPPSATLVRCWTTVSSAHGCSNFTNGQPMNSTSPRSSNRSLFHRTNLRHAPRRCAS